MNGVVDYRRFKLAIMWSGGMDGTAAYLWALKHGYSADDIALIFVNLGQPYVEKEIEAVLELKLALEAKKENFLQFTFNLLRESLGNLPTPELQVIPGRNFFLAYVGAFFADRVWICALDGEMHDFMLDKNQAFFDTASFSLTQIMGAEIAVETPFESMSKAEVVQWLVEQYGIERTQELMDMTSTCYHETERVCNRCTTCFKRWIAYRLAGLQWPHESRPDSDSIQSLIASTVQAYQLQDYSHYSRKRIWETETALCKTS